LRVRGATDYGSSAQSEHPVSTGARICGINVIGEIFAAYGKSTSHSNVEKLRYYVLSQVADIASSQLDKC
jgi:hypothetical protein